MIGSGTLLGRGGLERREGAGTGGSLWTTGGVSLALGGTRGGGGETVGGIEWSRVGTAGSWVSAFSFRMGTGGGGFSVLPIGTGETRRLDGERGITFGLGGLGGS